MSPTSICKRERTGSLRSRSNCDRCGSNRNTQLGRLHSRWRVILPRPLKRWVVLSRAHSSLAMAQLGAGSRVRSPRRSDGTLDVCLVAKDQHGLAKIPAPTLRQQAVGGMWVHWIQKGMDPEAGGKLFIGEKRCLLRRKESDPKSALLDRLEHQPAMNVSRGTREELYERQMSVKKSPKQAEDD